MGSPEPPRPNPKVGSDRGTNDENIPIEISLNQRTLGQWLHMCLHVNKKGSREEERQDEMVEVTLILLPRISRHLVRKWRNAD